MENVELACEKPIYFGIAIWGKDFFQKFIDHCLSSLLAAGNIPALPNLHKKNKFIFCTTAEDWEWFKSQQFFQILSQYLMPEFMPIKMIPEKDFLKNNEMAYKFHIVTQAHSDLVSYMYQSKAIGSLIFPDTIYSKDCFKSVFPHILKDDKKAILAHVPRLSTPILLQKLNEKGYIKSNQPLEIENRILVHNALMHMNTEVLAQNWESLYAFDFITDIWRPLQNNNLSNGLVAHSFAWCPIFLDYSKLHTHNIKCLENNTIDGNYLYSNFKFEDLYLVTDSDEFLMISYSPHTKLRVREKIYHNIEHINNIKKIIHWRKMIECSMGGFVDLLKLELLKIPVFMHANDLTKKDYQLRNYTVDLVAKILNRPKLSERLTEIFYTNKWINRIIPNRKRINNMDISYEDKLIEEHTL